jgi:enamine deaminase RidA (YjgF/YER057c/UK114 family)
MYRSTRELWLAFVAIVIISIIYLLAVILLGGIPAASDFFGHSLGVVGFLLMLMTETLYTLRKRSRSARWGRVSSWLQFHIVTGLVGPYMVLLHTSWKFNGLAGIVMLMTGVVVISGFIGRYIYTAIPRTVDGMEIEAGALQQQIEALEEEIDGWLARRPNLSAQLLKLSTVSASGSSQGIINPIGNLSYRINMWNINRKMDPPARAQAAKLSNLLKRRRTLDRQRLSLAQSRRLMALWHTLHVPIGLALFAAAFIHIGAAIYYATLLR